MINANENLSRVCRDFALPPWCGGLPHSKPQTPCIVVALLKEKNIRIPQKKYPEVVRVLADVTLS